MTSKGLTKFKEKIRESLSISPEQAQALLEDADLRFDRNRPETILKLLGKLADEDLTVQDRVDLSESLRQELSD